MKQQSVNAVATSAAETSGQPTGLRNPESSKRRADHRATRGEGRIYERAGSPFWWVAYFRRGKEFREVARNVRTRKKIEATEATRTDAEKFLKHRLNEITAEKYGGKPFLGPRGERLTVGELVGWVEADLKLRGKDSQQNLSNLARVRRDFGLQRAVAVTAEQIDAYIERRQKDGYANASINRTLQLLNQCYSLAIERKRLTERPSIRHLSEKGNERRGFFECAEFNAVLSNLPEYLKDFARFGYLTGWRKGEVSSLRWSDVDGDAILLRAENAKNGKARSVPIEGELEDLIERRRTARVVRTRKVVKISEFVFHRRGKPVGDIRKMWQRACCLAGVGRLICRKCNVTVDAEHKCPECSVTWQPHQLEYVGKLYHDFRRTAVRDMVRAGVPETVAMSISGHKTRSMFDRYNISNVSDQREALRATQIYRQQRAQEAAAQVN